MFDLCEHIGDELLPMLRLDSGGNVLGDLLARLTMGTRDRTKSVTNARRRCDKALSTRSGTSGLDGYDLLGDFRTS